MKDIKLPVTEGRYLMALAVLDSTKGSDEFRALCLRVMLLYKP